MVASKSSIPVTPLSKTIVIALFLVLIIFVFLLGVSYQKYPQLFKKQLKQPFVSQKRVCSIYGFLPKKQYLPAYTVKQGDNLLSIVRTQLRDQNRLQEFITLNNDIFPNLKNDPFLEVGWEVFLPPDYVKRSSGQIHVIAGQVIDDTKERWWVMDSPDVGGSFGVIVDKNTKFANEPKPKKRDCVVMIYDRNGINGATALFLQKQ